MPEQTTDASPPPAPAAELAPEVPLTKTRTRVRGRELALVTLLVSALYIPFLGSYNLWDPWETHYAEVARRMQEDHDWIRLRWQHENFRSKPVLTFWLMSGGMTALDVGDDGGFSGEMVSTSRVEWALRLPFALFGIFGIVALWYAMARLYSKRAAWFASVILATCPYYFLIARQAITDMPSCAMLIGSFALLALAILGEPDNPLPPLARIARWKLPWKITWMHGFLAVFALVCVPQLVYFTANLGANGLPLSKTSKIPGQLVMLPFILGFAGVCAWIWVGTKSTRQVYLYFFYLLNGLAVLAKGPVAPALLGLTIIGYLATTGDWKLLKRVEIVRGLIIGAVVCLPWHFAIYLKDGNPWLNEYVQQHLLNRAFQGVFQTKDAPGTFNYFFSQLGVGMWPWIAFVPAALASFAVTGKARTTEEKLRLLLGIWAIVGFFFFSVIQTKFHHYILPAVPALAALVAFWFDDLLDGKVRFPVLALGAALAILAFTSLDLLPHQEKLVHLFCFRYDRPWPKMQPWNIDFQFELTLLALGMAIMVLALAVPQLRRWAIYGAGGVALAFAAFAMWVMMPAVAPHWGQKTLHVVYYKKRQIHGVDLSYASLRPFAADWATEKDLPFRSYIPETMHLGDEMRVTWSVAGERGELAGRVAKIDAEGSTFWIHVPASERERIAGIVERAQNTKDAPGRRYVSINADRLLAWQLNWRGENFYSGGEIYQARNEDAKTVFMDTDNKAFLEYLKAPQRNGRGRKFWVITEKGRLAGLKGTLPTPYGKQTMKEEDNSSNKFGLGSFTMDEGTPPPIGSGVLPEQEAPSAPLKEGQEPGVGP